MSWLPTGVDWGQAGKWGQRPGVMFLAHTVYEKRVGLLRDLEMARYLGANPVPISLGRSTQSADFSVYEVGEKELEKKIFQSFAREKILAIKVGACSTEAVWRVLHKGFRTGVIPGGTQLVWDPVWSTSDGFTFMDAALFRKILRLVSPFLTVLTPNVPEWEAFGLPETPQRYSRLKEATVYLKGGHRAPINLRGAKMVWDDVWIGGTGYELISQDTPQWPGIRGTGCLLAAALTCFLAGGHRLKDAVVMARFEMGRFLRQTRELSQQVAYPMLKQKSCPSFPVVFPREKRAGFYPIASCLAELQLAATWEPPLLQLRVKNERLDAHALRGALSGLKQGTSFYLNDFWKLGWTLRCHGVHLGQEDLEEADLLCLAERGLHLGISTHTPWEVARALFYSPSYLAFGPICPTHTKDMPWLPQGRRGVAYWEKALGLGVTKVYIGGLQVQMRDSLMGLGVTSCAVLSDVFSHPSPLEQSRQWFEVFQDRRGFADPKA